MYSYLSIYLSIFLSIRLCLYDQSTYLNVSISFANTFSHVDHLSASELRKSGLGGEEAERSEGEGRRCTGGRRGGGGRRLRGSRGGAKNKKGVSSRSKVKTTIWHLFSRYFKRVLRGVIGGAKLLHRTIIFNGRFTQLTYGCPKTYEHGYSTFAPLGMMRRRVWGVYGGWAGCQTCTVSRWSPECFW